MAGITVVTDSTAYLPDGLAATRALTVIPLTVVLGGREGMEGVDITPADVANALIGRRASVTTSRPAPAEFEAVYRRLLDGGAAGVVSVHLSAKLSGTYDAAALAAADFDGRVEVVDSRSAGMGFGFAALAAADAAASGQDLTGVRDAAAAVADRVTTLFYVDSLEYLRRGGRIGAASALVGTALSVKPILHVKDGAIVVRDKVRTASRALARMVDLAVEAAGEGTADIAVHHLGSPERASELATSLTERLGTQVGDVFISEIGAVVAAHVGPGLFSVVVHRR
ncbi:MAG TPA: DegV family protein [Micromonosporaceae bacterium]|nr:DegV family protein [Micromonosporaceae bacterium]